MDKELQEIKKMLYEQNGNTNKEMEIIMRNKAKILELKRIMIKMNSFRSSTAHISRQKTE